VENHVSAGRAVAVAGLHLNRAAQACEGVASEHGHVARLVGQLIHAVRIAALNRDVAAVAAVNRIDAKAGSRGDVDAPAGVSCVVCIAGVKGNVASVVAVLNRKKPALRSALFSLHAFSLSDFRCFREELASAGDERKVGVGTRTKAIVELEVIHVNSLGGSDLQNDVSRSSVGGVTSRQVHASRIAGSGFARLHSDVACHSRDTRVRSIDVNASGAGRRGGSTGNVNVASKSHPRLTS